MYAIVLLPFLSMLRDAFRGRAVLQLELLALRHQLATIKRSSPRPPLRSADRLLWVILSRILPNWREVLVISEARDRRRLASQRLPPVLDLEVTASERRTPGGAP